MSTSIEDLEAKYDDFYTPRFRVSAGGDEYTEADGVLSDLEVDATVDGADRFSVTLNRPFGRGTDQGTFDDLDWDSLATGESVEVEMGYGEQLEPLFVGRINAVRPEFPEEGGPSVEISGYGLLYDMTRGTNSRSWDEATDSDVADEVASEYGFDEVDVEATDLTYQKVIQDDESDYRFLRRLADRNGFEVFANRGVLRFRAPPFDGDPTLELRYGESLLSFSPELSDSEQVGAVEVRHWDPKAKREIVGSAEADGVGEGTEVHRMPVWSKEEADRAAEALLARLSEDLVEGSGETTGLPELRTGETLRLEGLGERFSKVYYVERAVHRITGDAGYTTAFEVKERTI